MLRESLEEIQDVKVMTMPLPWSILYDALTIQNRNCDTSGYFAFADFKSNTPVLRQSPLGDIEFG
jgi:hypothetical protein